jgi:hypothetical protein
MDFIELINIFKKIEGLKLIETSNSPYSIVYEVLDEDSQLNLLSLIKEIKDKDVYIKENKSNFKLLILTYETNTLYKVYNQMLYLTLLQEEKRKNKFKELGIPDLSLVTIKQMTEELKKRNNLVFALVWIENNERDNIAIEGSGDPTQLVGLLSRGNHMAIEWADKSIKFKKD